MSILRSAAWRNPVATVLAKGTLAAARILFLLWVAKQHGPDTFGRLALCFSIVEILRMAVDFGTESLFLRHLARSSSRTDEAGLLARFGVFRLAALGLGLVLYGLAVSIILVGPTGWSDVLPGALLVTSTGIGYALTWYQAHLRMAKAAAIVLPVMLAGIVCFTVLRPEALERQLALLICFELASFTMLLVDLSTQTTLNLGNFRIPPLMAMRDVARESLPLAGVALLVTVYTRLDVLVIAPLAGAVALGLYSYAYRVSEPFRFIASAVDSTLYSYLSAQSVFADDRRRIGKLFTLVTSYAVAFAVGAAGVGWVLIQLVYQEYRAAVPTLFVLSGALLVRCLNGLLVSYLYARGRFTTVLKIAAINALVMALMIYPMVSILGIIGAACTLLIVECTNFVMQGRAVRLTIARTESNLVRGK